MVRLGFVFLLLAACARSTTIPCGDGVCLEGSACTPYQDTWLCVAPEQLTACEVDADLVTCNALDFKGTCHGGACLPIGCGNGRIDDPFYGTGEQCDDANRLGHDGCSSTCQVETPAWDEIAFASPPRTSEHAMVLASSTSTLWMFGGAGDGTTSLGELYERDRDAWQLRRRGVVAPQARFGHAAADDRTHGEVVMFGGIVSTRYQADTWTWNGTTWTQRSVEGPPARAYHAMAHDPRRGVTVLFGGESATGLAGDTWEYDGSTWTQPELDVSPGPMSRHMLVYDPARGVVVLVGERGGAVETWEYDGAWHAIETTTRPPSVRQTAAAFDGIDRAVVLVGDAGAVYRYDGTRWTAHTSATPSPSGIIGAAAAQEPVGGRIVLASSTAETSRWDGTSWTPLPQRSSSYVPPARQVPVASLDVHRGAIVMFGGRIGGVAVAELAEVDRDGWRQLGTVTPAPPARQGHAMAYDAARRRTLVFGGAPVDPSTWLWDGATWTEVVQPSGPRALNRPAVTYDAARQRIVMFGGRLANGVLVDETWEWDGTAWTQVALTGPRPQGRWQHALGYDPIREAVVLFGGIDASGPRDDTWTWDGAAWQEIPSTQAPTARTDHELVWDGARQRLVLIGGSIGSLAAEDIWELGPSGWTTVPVLAELAREGAVSVPAFDGAGVIAIAQTAFGGTMALRRMRWSAPTAYEACGGRDHDRDGLVGCDDPDCWARCSPTCPPGATCAANEARCGDGTCSTLESCRACPVDCGACPVACGDGVCSPGEDCVGDC